MNLWPELIYILIAWSIIVSVIILWTLRIKKILTNKMIYIWLGIIWIILLFMLWSTIFRMWFDIKNAVVFLPILIPLILFIFIYFNKEKYIGIILVICFLWYFWWKFLYNDYYVTKYNQPYVKLISDLNYIESKSKEEMIKLKEKCEELFTNCEIIKDYYNKLQEKSNLDNIPNSHIMSWSEMFLYFEKQQFDNLVYRLKLSMKNKF